MILMTTMMIVVMRTKMMKMMINKIHVAEVILHTGGILVSATGTVPPLPEGLTPSSATTTHRKIITKGRSVSIECHCYI